MAHGSLPLDWNGTHESVCGMCVISPSFKRLGFTMADGWPSKFAATPFKARSLSAHRISSMRQEIRRVVLPQGPIEVREFGPRQGTPIVFVHGVLANGRLWDEVALALSRGHRCIVPHWPLGAHSEPMNRDADLSPDGVVTLIVALLDALSIERAHFVGNDSGGALCQMLVERAPERIESLVLASCDAYDVWLPPLFKPFEFAAFLPGALFVVSQLLRIRVLRRLPFALGWLALRMRPDIELVFTKPFASSQGVRRDLAKFLRGISPRLTLRAAKSFASFARPVLIAWSKNDRFFDVRLAERLARELPNAKLEFIEDARTYSPLDNPAQLATKIGAFLGAKS